MIGGENIPQYLYHYTSVESLALILLMTKEMSN